MILHMFAADPVIVSYLFFLDDGPKSTDDEDRNETRLLNDAGIVRRISDGRARITAVIVVTCRNFGLTVYDSRTESMLLRLVSSSTEVALHIKAVGRRYK